MKSLTKVMNQAHGLQDQVPFLVVSGPSLASSWKPGLVYKCVFLYKKCSFSFLSFFFFFYQKWLAFQGPEFPRSPSVCKTLMQKDSDLFISPTQ